MTSAFSQLLRFGIVGVLANLSLYMVYLALVFMGLAPIWAMTTAFLMGVVVSFVFNAKWTFDASTSADAFRRMLICYFAAWLLNAITLYVLVDGLKWPHHVVQGSMILCLAIILFGCQKFWVFRG